MDLTNQFLIAMPNLTEAPFEKSVVYICQHDAEGAMGFIINKPVESSMRDILQHLEIDVSSMRTDDQIYVGGPVQPEHGFVLHSPIGDWRTSMAITDDVAITTSKDILQAVANGDGPENLVVTLGYSGWDPGQIEEEVMQSSWLTCEASIDVLFKIPVAERWEAAVKMAGIHAPYQISSFSGHA